MLRSERLSNRWLIYATSAASLVAFLVSARPGWMTKDSEMMWLQAVNGDINDWHSPILVWLWSHLAPASLGPLMPLVIQSVLFWLGLMLVSLRLHSMGLRYAWLLPPLAFLLSVTWTVAWLWKDSLAMALMVLALGLASWSRDLSPTRRHVAVVAASSLVGLVLAARWYLLPTLVVAVLALWRISQPSPRVTLRSRVLGASLAAFLLVAASLMAVENLVIKPRPSYVAGSLMMLDIARVECVVGSAEQRAAGDSLFPQELIRKDQGDTGSDICVNYSPIYHDAIWESLAKEGSDPYYVLPADSQQMSDLTERWKQAAVSHPGLLLEARLKVFYSFLANSSIWWGPSQVTGTASVAVSDSMGEGGEVGFPSTGGSLLAVLATVTALGTATLLNFGTTAFGLLSLVMAPLVVLLLLRRRPVLRWRYLWSLLVPILWCANLSLVAVSYDFRYMTPAACWGVLVSLLAVAEVRTDNARPDPDTQTSDERGSRVAEGSDVGR